MKEKPGHDERVQEADIEKFELEIWAAEMGDVPKIDLHGLSKDIAVSELETFLHQEMMAGTGVIKIVHGRGAGKMKDLVHVWLEKQKKDRLVLHFRDSRAPGQAGGTTFALLESIKK